MQFKVNFKHPYIVHLHYLGCLLNHTDIMTLFCNTYYSPYLEKYCSKFFLYLLIERFSTQKYLTMTQGTLFYKIPCTPL